MKTLKQQLQEKYHLNDAIYYCEEDIIETVKEWLTQKRPTNITANFPSNDFIAIQRFINELLEELNQS